MTRVGVLGGTFDPLHLGHLRAAEVVREALSLDKVLFVPAATPPHKAGVAVSAVAHRVGMIESALSGERHFELCGIEVARGGASYTIDTLSQLSEQRPADHFYFITGTDAFVDIRTWKQWERLLDNYGFAVHERPGRSIDDMAAALPGDVTCRFVEASGDCETKEPRIVLIRGPMLQISSTEIRESVVRGRSIRFLVPDDVEAYIRRNRLYLME